MDETLILRLFDEERRRLNGSDVTLSSTRYVVRAIGSQEDIPNVKRPSGLACLRRFAPSFQTRFRLRVRIRLTSVLYVAYFARRGGPQPLLRDSQRLERARTLRL